MRLGEGDSSHETLAAVPMTKLSPQGIFNISSMTDTNQPRLPLHSATAIPTTTDTATTMRRANESYTAAAQASIMAHDKQRQDILTAKSNMMENTAPPCKYRKLIGGGKEPSLKALRPVSNPCEVSPQAYLDALLQSRGYSTQSYCSLEGGYYCKPTPLQMASYGSQIMQAVRKSDSKLLGSLFQGGLSRNPCNSFGESLLHSVCRRSDYKMLGLMVENGSSVQVSDDFGRTPLHDACWTARPNFECVRILLERDVRLLRIVDCRGCSPLSYIKRELWADWIDFFDSQKDVFWKPRDVTAQGPEPPPPLTQVAAHTNPPKDPPNAASLDDAILLASGRANTTTPTPSSPPPPSSQETTASVSCPCR